MVILVEPLQRNCLGYKMPSAYRSILSASYTFPNRDCILAKQMNYLASCALFENAPLRIWVLKWMLFMRPESGHMQGHPTHPILILANSTLI